MWTNYDSDSMSFNSALSFELKHWFNNRNIEVKIIVLYLFSYVVSELKLTKIIKRTMITNYHLLSLISLHQCEMRGLLKGNKDLLKCNQVLLRSVPKSY